MVRFGKREPCENYPQKRRMQRAAVLEVSRGAAREQDSQTVLRRVAHSEAEPLLVLRLEQVGREAAARARFGS